jgi:type VI secretion system protein ImpM
MGSGYFGKLPARADFVIGHCPKGFLNLWEPFLMQGLAQSRQDLGDAWKEAYMTMPVWRFLIEPLAPSEGTLAQGIAGAFMPSVDKVGREFPLTLVAGIGTQDGQAGSAWYGDAETILLGVLREEASLEAFQEAAAGMEPPSPATDTAEQAIEAPVLAAMPESDTRVRSRFWCRAGETEFAFACEGLPAAEAFRWLVLPEHYSAPADQETAAGDMHGRYHPEDHRT